MAVDFARQLAASIEPSASCSISLMGSIADDHEFPRHDRRLDVSQRHVRGGIVARRFDPGTHELSRAADHRDD